MDHFVKLDRLPDGFEFPPKLKDRFHFDAEAHKLVFRGYMSKADFDHLSELTNDWRFRRTLEELFRRASPNKNRLHTDSVDSWSRSPSSSLVVENPDAEPTVVPFHLGSKHRTHKNF